MEFLGYDLGVDHVWFIFDMDDPSRCLDWQIRKGDTAMGDQIAPSVRYGITMGIMGGISKAGRNAIQLFF
jgi:hypothetical protein